MGFVTNAAVDVGYGRTKGRRKGRECDLRSVIGDYKQVRFSLGESTEQRIALQYNDKKYTVDEAAIAQSTPQATIDEKRAFSEEGLVLLLAALVKLTDGNPAENVNLVVGLPVLYYDTYKNDYLKAIKKIHAVDILKMDSDLSVRKYFSVENAKVLPQPVGIIFDLITDDDGKMTDEQKKLAQGNLGAISIGFNTVELARVDNLDYKNRRSTSFLEMGMFTVFQELSDEIFKYHKVRVQVEKMEPVYRSGYIKKEGEMIDISKLKMIALETVASKVLSSVKSFWQDRWELDKIAIAGGGAIDLAAFIARDLGKQAVIVERPLFSTVDGFFKYAQRTWK
jgi:hypothetical protein